MKKKILWLISSLFCMFGFALNVNAAPSTIQAGKVTNLQEYVSGYQAYLKKTSDLNHELYCEVANLPFPSNKTLNLGSEVNKGFVYILNNKPNTSDSNKNYYIMQMAVWWYKDILNGNNNNLSASFKNTCTSTTANDTCKSIYNLVKGAVDYKEPRGEISFSSGTINFTESYGYFISDKISLDTSNLSSMKDLKLVGAPYGATIINSTVNTYNKKGTFQVRVPVESVSSGKTVSFTVETEGVYKTYSAYDYIYTTAYQRVIYDVVYSVDHPVYMSKTLRITREAEEVKTNQLTIYKVDENGYSLRGAVLTLYSGDCVNKTCLNRDIYASWTTTNYAKEFTDIPVGYYTIVETGTPTGYQTAEKALIYVKRDDQSYTYTVKNYKEKEVKPVRISKTDITGATEIAGATLVIKDTTGKEVASWISETKPKYLTLAEGEYTLVEKYAPAGYKLTTTVVYFKVDKEGNVSAKDSTGKYAAVEYLKLVNETNDMVNISKLDASTNAYLTGATLVIKNEKGEIVTTWTTTNASYNVALGAGYYTLTETTAPAGYNLNNKVIYFRVMEDGTLMVRNDNQVYELAYGIIMYNQPVLEEETVVVPKTGLTSVVTYTLGGLTLLSGAYLLKKNGQFSI